VAVATHAAVKLPCAAVKAPAGGAHGCALPTHLQSVCVEEYCKFLMETLEQIGWENDGKWQWKDDTVIMNEVAKRHGRPPASRVFWHSVFNNQHQNSELHNAMQERKQQAAADQRALLSQRRASVHKNRGGFPQRSWRRHASRAKDV